MFLIVFFVMIAIVWLTQSLRFIDLITSKGINFFSFVQISSFLILPMAYICIPIALFIAVIITVHNFNLNHEIEILKCAGLSNWQIFKGFTSVIAIIITLHIGISLYLLPQSYRAFKDMQHWLKEQFIFSAFEEGVFNTQNSDITIYIDEKLSYDDFKGIFIYDFRNKKQPVTLMANRGQLLKADNGINFVLMNGTRQIDDREKHNVSLAFFETYRFSMRNENSITSERYVDVNELFLDQLLDNAGKSERQIEEHLVVAMQRITWPLFSFILALLACSFVLQGSSKRKSMLHKEVSTAFFGLGIIMLLMFFNNLAVKNFHYIYYSIATLVSSSVFTIVKFRKSN